MLYWNLGCNNTCIHRWYSSLKQYLTFLLAEEIFATLFKSAISLKRTNAGHDLLNWFREQQWVISCSSKTLLESPCWFSTGRGAGGWTFPVSQPKTWVLSGLRGPYSPCSHTAWRGWCWCGISPAGTACGGSLWSNPPAKMQTFQALWPSQLTAKPPLSSWPPDGSPHLNLPSSWRCTLCRLLWVLWTI